MAQPQPVQLTFEGCCPIRDAVEQLALHSGTAQRGAIYTRREVVDFILDLVGYTANRPLTSFRLLEPSMGIGAHRADGAHAFDVGGPAEPALAGAGRVVEVNQDRESGDS